ncbi:MAG TPA: TetR/AcrR family transcriptional regulator [Kofleriaceae bacterium]|nr:TetR/AcrR family transcriptional regulator [Kofleriaceae bacterium]
MYRQVKTTPRKRPRQERSKVTVDTILAATARVLVKKGFDGLTTNAVAEAAGVSIGSLYQYFPSKEALVAALIEQHIDEMNAAILHELTRVAQLPMAQAVRAVIELTIRAHSIEPELHRVLTEQVPRVGRLARLAEADGICRRMVAGILAARKDELAIADPDTAAFVLVASIEAITHRAALFAPERLRDPRLIDEAVALVTRYLGIADN